MYVWFGLIHTDVMAIDVGQTVCWDVSCDFFGSCLVFLYCMEITLVLSGYPCLIIYIWVRCF
jgi:hypothetical protein